MRIVPVTLKEANNFVDGEHRHNGRTARDGGKYAIGLTDEERLIGVAIVGNPLARMLNDGYTAEVLRCCVLEGSQKGANSKLYMACWRAWRAMGGLKMITYTKKSEGGASLRGAGFKVVAEVKPSKGWSRDGRERKYQPIYGEMKLRWEIAVQ